MTDRPASFAEAMASPIDRALFADSLDIALGGGCGLCDTEGDHLCVGCGKCRCCDHDGCVRPAGPVPARTNTPNVINADGSTTITMKRCCNGCGQYLGDVDQRDVDERGELTDVRAECAHCRPLVEAEAEGCKTWELTPRSYARVAHEIDRLRPWVFTKGYWQTVDGELQVVGLRVGQYPDHVVAYFGDWIIRRPDGVFTVHPAPAAESGE